MRLLLAQCIQGLSAVMEAAGSGGLGERLADKVGGAETEVGEDLEVVAEKVALAEAQEVAVEHRPTKHRRGTRMRRCSGGSRCRSSQRPPRDLHHGRIENIAACHPNCS